jgi:ABC-type polysaccharide/polyol phosphate export permease
VAASAVLGALTIYARRDGVPIFESDLGVPVGLLLHLVICFAWGAIFAIIAAPWRGLKVLGVAIIVSGLAWILSPTLFPPALQLGNDLYASLPRAAVVHALMALGFVIGMRLAQV